MVGNFRPTKRNNKFSTPIAYIIGISLWRSTALLLDCGLIKVPVSLYAV